MIEPILNLHRNDGIFLRNSTYLPRCSTVNNGGASLAKGTRIDFHGRFEGCSDLVPNITLAIRDATE